MDSETQRTPATGTANTYVADQRVQNSESCNRCNVYHRIDEIRKFLESEGVGLFDVCADAASRTCWLCWNTTPWNRLLFPLNLELVVSGPRELCLRSIHVDSEALSEDLKYDDALYDAAFVFAWLLKQHRCVQTICLRADDLSLMPVYSLKLALDSSANLRHVKFVRGYSTLINEQELSEGLKSFTRLKSFEFFNLDVTPVLASTIAALLRRNERYLVKVNFAHDHKTLSRRCTATILSALIGCKALTELSFANHLSKRSVKAMARVVRVARLLKKLSLRLHFFRDCGPIAAALKDHKSLQELSLRVYPAPLVPVFEALETNTTLRHLDVDSSRSPADDIAALANLLRCNKTLRRVSSRNCGLIGDGAALLADVIVGNDTLETLDLSGCEACIEDVATFCTALEKNKTLKTVYFHSVLAWNEERVVLARLISQSKCYSRIVVPWKNADLPPLTAALALPSQSPSELCLENINWVSTTLLRELLSALAGNTKVKRLDIKACGCGDDQADTLCQALAANRSIKILEVRAQHERPKEPIFNGVTKALMTNAAITELILHRWHMCLHSSEAFAGMLAQNKTLTTITFYCHEPLGAEQLEMLSQGMMQNRVVTSFTVDTTLPRNNAAFLFHEAIRRNITLLNMAVQFVLQADVTKRCAQAFETLRRTSSLVSQLAKVSGQSEKEAAAAVDAADRYLRSHFLFVTGVVRDAVRCYPGTGKQLDALNDPCWQAIAEYLKVSDVRDG